jgi:hypothetical protein
MCRDDWPMDPDSNPDSGSQSLTLEQLFGAANDELAIPSICGTRPSADDDWILSHGTLLVVPEACAAISWPEWTHQQGGQHSSRVDPPLAPSLSAHDENWLLPRQVCDAHEAEEWLGDLWEQPPTEGAIRLPQLGCVPELQARLDVRPSNVVQLGEPSPGGLWLREPCGLRQL